MNRFSAISVAALMILTVFASVALADVNNTSVTNAVEIRGPVYNGTDLPSIINNQGSAGSLTMDANKFAAFFYDINNNVTTETLSIKNIAGTSGNTIGENGLVYSTTVAQTAYQYTKDAPDATTLAAWGNYSVIGFFADKYIPLIPTDASKLAKLVLDTDTKYSLKTGDKLDLSSGYSLQCKQVDVNGNKVWLELDYNGQYIDDAVIDASTGDHTWQCKLSSVDGQSNVYVFRAHVSSVFQGAVDSVAQIDGLWLIDLKNPLNIDTSASFGKLDNVALDGPTITINNKDSFSLSRNSDVEIGNGLFFKVADSSALRFYAYKQETNPGTYDIRGTVATGAQSWNGSSFAGFFYDIKNDVSTESLKVLHIDGRTIPENDLVYSTTVKNVDYKYTSDAPDSTTLAAWGSYPVLGFMAQEYVPLLPTDASKLAKLVIDSDDKYSLKTGEKLDLGSGYSIQCKQVDVNGNKVWIELDYNGQYVDDAVIDASTGDHTWQDKLSSVDGQSNVYVFRVHVSNVFQGSVDSVAQIDGLWLMDFKNPINIDTSASFGKLDNVALDGPTITINNKDSFDLSRNTDHLDINGQGMYFNVADNAVLRYYPFVEETIGGNGTIATTTPSASSVNATTTPAVNATTAPSENVTETPVAGETPAAVGETPVAVANNTTAKPNTPGFDVLPAIFGLLVVVYLVRKNK
jgi:S-layer protein (TIGR01567 family)